MSIFDDVNQVRDSSPIAVVISRTLHLTPTRPGVFVGTCPFHVGGNLTLLVRSELERFHCYECNADGDVFAFIMRTEKVTFAEAVARLRPTMDAMTGEGRA